MDISEKHKEVMKAYGEVREEIGKDIFSMLGVNQRLQLVQDKLPTKPLYSIHAIRQIVFKDKGE